MLHAINAKKNAQYNVACTNFRVRHWELQPRLGASTELTICIQTNIISLLYLHFLICKIVVMA